MNEKVDNRLKCSDDKRIAIYNSLQSTKEKRKSQTVKCYELKIVKSKLNSKQIEELERMFIEGKWFYNHVLNLHQNGQKLNSINTTNIKSVDHYDKDKNLVSTTLQVLNSQQKQGILTRMQSNQKTIIKLVKSGKQTHGSLQFKTELNSIPLKQYGFTHKFKSLNKVKIAGIHGSILVKGTHQLKNIDEYANAVLLKKPDGYYLKLTCYINKDNIESIEAIEANGKEIGLDFGIKTNITTSEGKKIDVSVEESERLKMLQKKLQRQTKGSNNRYRTIQKLRREYQYLSNVKKDKANKIVHELKQYSTIVIQDEQLNKWHQQKGMSNVVQHSFMGFIKNKLMNFPQTIVLDKYIPTTKWCPKCHKLNELTLNDRTYVCECGYQEDRDIHAAKNMLLINNLVKNNFTVPTEHREIKREEFCFAER